MLAFQGDYVRVFNEGCLLAATCLSLAERIPNSIRRENWKTFRFTSTNERLVIRSQSREHTRDRRMFIIRLQARVTRCQNGRSRLAIFGQR